MKSLKIQSTSLTCWKHGRKEAKEQHWQLHRHRASYLCLTFPGSPCVDVILYLCLCLRLHHGLPRVWVMGDAAGYRDQRRLTRARIRSSVSSVPGLHTRWGDHRPDQGTRSQRITWTINCRNTYQCCGVRLSKWRVEKLTLGVFILHYSSL